MSKSRRPYLIRAIYDWACDIGEAPHLVVAADYDGVAIPREHVRDGRITLNVSPGAVQSLDLAGDVISFNARFGGRPFHCVVPAAAVLAVFGRESGEGIVFGEVEPPTTGDDVPPPEDTPPPKRSHLRVVK
jgi:stringent starvation protein B